MSRHQAVRNLDYQDELDDFEGYSDEGADELSPEDQALMASGIAAVSLALGDNIKKISKATVEESLWHYYFDADKTVAYLTSKFIDPPKKTHKANGKLLISPFQSGKIPSSLRRRTEKACPRPVTRVCELVLSPPHPQPSLTLRQGLEYTRELPPVSRNAVGSESSLSHYFRDMPWGNIPKDRETILIPPQRPRGGLLGGSGSAPKLSKLQQLAAARKKKAEEKGTQDKLEQARTQMKDLSVNEPSRKENPSLSGAFGKRLKTSESIAEGRNPITDIERTRSGTAQQPLVDIGNEQHPTEESTPLPPPEQAKPSVFAQTLFGSASDKPKRKLLEFFSLPYMAIVPSSLDAFSSPSPDDVVIAAQAKGSLLGKSNR